MPPAMYIRRATKIVATLGPVSSDLEVLTRMISTGVNVVRFNFSHGSAQDHLARAESSNEVRRPTPIHRWWPSSARHVWAT